MQQLPATKEMARAVRDSDTSYDGVFIVAVRTTGVFCRPSCRARKPLPKNCEYYGSVRAALFAGYRPCKRCRPLEVTGRPPDWVQRLLQRVENDPGARIRDGFGALSAHTRDGMSATRTRACASRRAGRY